MRASVIYGPGDVRSEELPEPTIIEPTDAIVRNAATWCLRGPTVGNTAASTRFQQPQPFGHEYCGVVEAVGDAVTSVKPGQFVIGSFFVFRRHLSHTAATDFKPLALQREFMVRVPGRSKFGPDG